VRKKKPTRACAKCGKSFPVSREGNAKLCPPCREAKCVQCGKPFVPKWANHGQKYCSPKCSSDSRKGAEPPWLAANRGVRPRTYHLHHRDFKGQMAIDWRSAVYLRDNYTCQKCGQRGGRLNAHHVKPFKDFPELAFDVSNGQTLCVPCHKETDTFGWQKYNAWRKAKK
jgi:DNA-directed RNA polymerase subunit RPC12/RpoP